MSEYSDNLYEIEWAVWGDEIIGDLEKLTETGPVLIKSVQVGLPLGLSPSDYSVVLGVLLARWTNFAIAGFEAQGWTGEFAPPLVADRTKIYHTEWLRPTHRVPVQVSYDYLELITEVSV